MANTILTVIDWRKYTVRVYIVYLRASKCKEERRRASGDFVNPVGLDICEVGHRTGNILRAGEFPSHEEVLHVGITVPSAILPKWYRPTLVYMWVV